MLPDTVVNAALAIEISNAAVWANRNSVDFVSLFPSERVVRVVLVQEQSRDSFFLQGTCDQYPALPPIWQWCTESWDCCGARACGPAAARTPFGASMFLSMRDRAIICAPFNRLAYGALDGPHSDWGDPVHWRNAGKGYVHAETIADMLSAIRRDFICTTRRMS